MNYYRRKDDIIEKYLIKYDKESIKALRRNVINECSEIVHKDYNATCGPNTKDAYRIRNCSCIKIGYKEYNDAPDAVLYRFCYDEYIYPELVELIDKFLQGDIRVIDNIFDLDNIRQKIPYDIKIEKLSDDIDKIPNMEYERKKQALEKLKELVEESKLNKNQKPVDEYYKKFQELLSFELVDSILVSEVERINRFFDKKTSDFEELNSLKKILK